MAGSAIISWMQLKNFLKYLYLYGIIIGGSILLVEWHTGQVSRFIHSFRGPPAISRDADALPGNAEIDPADETTRWEALSRKEKWQTIIDETENRKDNVAVAYRTLAILESGKSILLLEAMQNLKDLLKVRDLPNNLSTRLVRGLGDPEAPGPTARENLEAYKEIINSLRIATQPASLKKLRELEALAAEEAAAAK